MSEKRPPPVEDSLDEDDEGSRRYADLGVPTDEDDAARAAPASERVTEDRSAQRRRRAGGRPRAHTVIGLGPASADAARAQQRASASLAKLWEQEDEPAAHSAPSARLAPGQGPPPSGRPVVPRAPSGGPSSTPSPSEGQSAPALAAPRPRGLAPRIKPLGAASKPRPAPIPLRKAQPPEPEPVEIEAIAEDDAQSAQLDDAPPPGPSADSAEQAPAPSVPEPPPLAEEQDALASVPVAVDAPSSAPALGAAAERAEEPGAKPRTTARRQLVWSSAAFVATVTIGVVAWALGAFDHLGAPATDAPATTEIASTTDREEITEASSDARLETTDADDDWAQPSETAEADDASVDAGEADAEPAGEEPAPTATAEAAKAPPPAPRAPTTPRRPAQKKPKRYMPSDL